jgi:hypothetical protein
MEMRDTSYYVESDVTKHISAPFVISIPELSTALEERQRKWRGMFQWLAAAAMLLVVFAADFYVVRNRF